LLIARTLRKKSRRGSWRNDCGPIRWRAVEGVKKREPIWNANTVVAMRAENPLGREAEEKCCGICAPGRT